MTTAPRLVPLDQGEWTAESRALLRGKLPSADRYLRDDGEVARLPNILGLFGHQPELAAEWLGWNAKLLENRLFGPYSEIAGRRPGVSVISGRDDLLSLHGRRKSRVVGLAEHVAGLQFETVLVTGFPDWLSSNDCPAHRLRFALTLLYLACSRAEQRLELFLDRDLPVPMVLAKAVRGGVVVEEKSQ